MTAAAAGPTARPDNRAMAMLAICLAVMLASTGDAIVKAVSGSYPIHQVLAIRCLGSFPVLLALIAADGGFGSLLPREIGRVLVRAAILCVAYLSFTLAIAAMPLADAVAIYFTMPFFVAGLAGPLLGERVPVYRWLSIAAGFGGVMVMIRPGGGVFEPAALLALLSAAGYAVGQMMGRPLSRTVQPSVMAFYQNVLYLAVALAMAALFHTQPGAAPSHGSLAFLTRPWAMPTPADLGWLLALAFSGAMAMPLFGTAYKLAPANFVAPFEYTTMFWAMLFGVVVFADIPDLTTLVGGGIVIAAGLYMLSRDAVALSRDRSTP